MRNTPPKALKLHRKSQELELSYGLDEQYRLSSEMLRVLSPSAEVRGHGSPVLQTGKKHVQITSIEMVGHYAIKIVFDDGHDSGLYNWEYLYDLCLNREQHWEDYLRQMHEAGASRDPDASVVQLISP